MSHEFKVVLDIDLSDADVKLVNRAIQRAVMEAIDGIEVPEKVSVHRPICSHGVCGIVIRPYDHPSPLDPPKAG